MGEVITRHSLRPLRFPRAKLFAPLGRERVAGSHSCVHVKSIAREDEFEVERNFSLAPLAGRGLG